MSTERACLHTKPGGLLLSEFTDPEVLGTCWLAVGCCSFVTVFLLFDSSPEQQQLGFEHHSSNLVCNSDLYFSSSALYPSLSLGVGLFLLLLEEVGNAGLHHSSCQ